ncbi:MAG: arsenate reductase [Gammaproteobacteria bacterium]|nr:MAG: arsenate reductase [Gammaproteobacteria bacterium]
MTTLYGIPNCDTVKKARRWLDDHGVAYRFHDLREDPVGDKRLAQWLAAVGADTLVNRRSTTWKQLAENDRPDSGNPETVIACLSQHPTLVKRPVLEHGKTIHAGFNTDDYTRLFNLKT